MTDRKKNTERVNLRDKVVSFPSEHIPAVFLEL